MGWQSMAGFVSGWQRFTALSECLSEGEMAAFYLAGFLTGWLTGADGAH